MRYPATLAQQRFWVLDRLEPGNSALNVAVRWRIEGELAPGIIENAFKLILARHEPLRTSFADADGEPIQIVRASAELRVPSIDLTVLPEADAVAECDRIAQAEAQTPFNLAISPLIRVTHVKLRADLAILLVTSHHAICDGWSIGLLAKEIGEICEALQSGRLPVLPELPITYGEFSLWQQEFIAEGGLAEDIKFWSQSLDGMGFFELQTDYPRSSALPPTGAIQSVLLGRSLSQALTHMARGHDCTLFMAAVSGLLTLLHRYTGATDIVLGTQVAGRNLVEIESLVGLFINTLVLRADLSGDPDFIELMVRVREIVAAALEHDAMPLEKVIELLRPKRYPGYNAVFSVNFIFQRSFVANADHGQFRLVDLPSYSAGAMYDLNFFMVERPEGWRASCEYNTSLYDESTIARLLRHFVRILAFVAAEPTASISAVPILDESERRCLLFDCNDTATAYPRHLSLPHLVARQALRTPDAIAVVDADRTFSYRDIEQRSNALAATLLKRGIGPGARVGVFVRRSADLVIAPLAIMKAGNAYVPLDPVYPPARLRQIVEQSDLSAIISQSAVVSAQIEGVAIVAADDLTDKSDEDIVMMLPALHPDDTAYIIFTSGSTGQPKGVQVLHRGLTNFLWSMRQRPGFGAKDTTVAVTTICFDIAVLELFLPLTVGARIVIANEEETRDGRLLLSLIRRSRARLLQATPTTWRMLIEAGWQGDPQLRMLCGGEALTRDLAGRLLALSPELWNMYGPTETTIWSSVKQIGIGDAAVALGPPIGNTQFYVVDARGEPVPQGAAGELLIGGDGVALGYWGMPDATRERFAPDRFRNLPGERLYRTGDIVRMHRPGDWQFLGRADDQVKIRGYRIELGEIEAALLQHPQVRNAVAMVGEGAAGETSIFAYVEPRNPETASVRDQVLGELRTQLAQILPAYMRPSAIMMVDALPRLPNGKTDRKSLPRPVAGNPLAERRPQAVDEFEDRLKEIWCSVLGLSSIDETADFFELGGHSLLAARLLARIETAFGRRVTLSSLFESPSFAAFKKLVQSSEHREFDFRQVVQLQPQSGKRGIFAINNTGIYLTLSRRLGENLPITALQLFDPSFPRGPLPGSIDEIAQQYIELVRHLQPRGPYAFLGWCNGGVLAFEMARQLQEAGEHVAHVIVVDTWLPGYLGRLGPLHSRLANYSYRWKMVVADWAEIRASKKGIMSFLTGRKTLRTLFLSAKRSSAPTQSNYVAEEDYDRWLVTYLDSVIKTYEPKPFAGRMTVFRSRREPTGLFLDPKLGWEPFAVAGVDLVCVPGNHYSIFQEPGTSIMAKHIESVIATDFATSS